MPHGLVSARLNVLVSRKHCGKGEFGLSGVEKAEDRLAELLGNADLITDAEGGSGDFGDHCVAGFQPFQIPAVDFIVGLGLLALRP